MALLWKKVIKPMIIMIPVYIVYQIKLAQAASRPKE